MFFDGCAAVGGDLRLRRFALGKARGAEDLREGDVNARREEAEQLVSPPEMLEIVEIEQSGVGKSMAEIGQDGGLSVSTKSPSVSVGTRPCGLSLRYSGVWCSPFRIVTRFASNSAPASSSTICAASEQAPGE